MDNTIIDELKRRQEILIENSNADDIHILSQTRFIMALAPIGYPIEPEPWMDINYLKHIMTDEQFNSYEYDQVFDELYKDTIKRVKQKENNMS